MSAEPIVTCLSTDTMPPTDNERHSFFLVGGRLAVGDLLIEPGKTGAIQAP